MRNDYYVYGHYLNENDTTPFYIGKGCRSRAYSKSGRNKLWHKTVFENNGYVVKFIATDMTDKEAYSLEVKLIKEYGRKNINTGVLVNGNFGGEQYRELLITAEIENQIKKTMSITAQRHRHLRFL